MDYVRWTDLGFDHSPYWAYLKSVEGVMPGSLHAFASNPENHDLTSPNSLHDASLRCWKVTEPALPPDATVEIDIELLGPQWDRLIRLWYGEVISYTVDESPAVADQEGVRRGHGDLLVHELRMAEDDSFRHELVFSSGTVFLVQFRAFGHAIEMLDEPVKRRPKPRRQSP